MAGDARLKNSHTNYKPNLKRIMDLKKVKFRTIAMGVSAVLLAFVFVTSCGKKDDNICIQCSASVSQSSGNAGNVTTSSMENCGSTADVNSAEATFRALNTGSTINCTRK